MKVWEEGTMKNMKQWENVISWGGAPSKLTILLYDICSINQIKIMHKKIHSSRSTKKLILLKKLKI